jgi:hypothetical protein
VRAAANNPGRTIPVFERTQTCASARVFWKALQELDDTYNLECRFHNSLFLATLPNRSEIIVLGADTADAADKARGDAYPEAIVDEAGTFRPHILEYLLNDVLAAALFDYGGACVLSGTPSVRPVGPFADACASSGVNPKVSSAWTEFHWTLFDNPHLPKDAAARGLDAAARAALRDQRFREEMASKGLSRESPFVQRVYRGRWVLDRTLLAYHGISEANYVGVVGPDDLHTHPERYVWGLGIDLGYNDPTAFVVIARARNRSSDPTYWVVESYEQSGLIPSAVAAHVARLQLRYPIRGNIVADTGGYGKGPAAEMASARWGIAVRGVRKSAGYKEAARNFMNGDLQAGRIRYVEAGNRDLIHDTRSLRIDPETNDEDPRDPNHLPDACLYILQDMATSDRGLGERDVLVATPETPEWAEAQHEALHAAAMAAAGRAARGPTSPVDLPDY